MRRRLLLTTLAAALFPASGLSADPKGARVTGPDGLPLIFWLIKSRDRAAVDAWLDAGGDIEARGYHRATPILTAAIIDDWPMVLHLAGRGARIDISDGRGFTLGWLIQRSRVRLDGPFGPALIEMRGILDRAGLLDLVRDPAEVRASP
jgi:hypothetical protein